MFLILSDKQAFLKLTFDATEILGKNRRLIEMIYFSNLKVNAEFSPEFSNDKNRGVTNVAATKFAIAWQAEGEKWQIKGKIEARMGYFRAGPL